MDPMYSSLETQGSSASKASTDSKKCNWLMYLLLGIVCVIILAVIGFVIAIAVNGTKSVDKEIDVFVKGGAKPDDNANAPSADNGALTARPALKSRLSSMPSSMLGFIQSHFREPSASVS